MGDARSSSCPMSAKASPRPSSSSGTSRSATVGARGPVLAAVMTDKATVEIPSPVAGKVVWHWAARSATRSRSAPSWCGWRSAGEGNEEVAAAPREAAPPRAAAGRAADRRRRRRRRRRPQPTPVRRRQRRSPARSLGPPRPRRARSRSPRRRCGCARARPASTCARCAAAARPAASATRTSTPSSQRAAAPRRRRRPRRAHRGRGRSRSSACAGASPRRWRESKRRIPHFTYVEEVDVTALEELRARSTPRSAGPAAADPAAVPDAGAGAGRSPTSRDQRALRRRGRDHRAPCRRAYRHRHADAAGPDGAGGAPLPRRAASGTAPPRCAGSPRRRATAQATREELSGSTITITSLGALGGIVTTPVHQPARGGDRRRQQDQVVRPVWHGAEFVPRKMMNLSSSFDHRVIDGWDAAAVRPAHQGLLEAPATIFMEA